jgi:DnaJ-class molecular chaperone
MNRADALGVLNLDSNFTEKELKTQYKKSVIINHPDKGGNDADFTRVKEAYNFLKISGSEPEPEPRSTNRGWTDYGFENDIRWGDIDIRAMMSGKDVRVNILLSIEDISTGCRKKINIDGDILTIDIPKGVCGTQPLVLKGRGGKRVHGDYKDGDLYVYIKPLSHGVYSFRNQDLYYQVFIDLVLAIYGGHLVVPTLYGDIKLTIPSGLSGKVLRVPHKGLFDPTTKIIKCLYVIVDIIIPDGSKLPEEAKENLIKFNELCNLPDSDNE